VTLIKTVDFGCYSGPRLLGAVSDPAYTSELLDASDLLNNERGTLFVKANGGLMWREPCYKSKGLWVPTDTDHFIAFGSRGNLPGVPTGSDHFIAFGSRGNLFRTTVSDLNDVTFWIMWRNLQIKLMMIRPEWPEWPFYCFWVTGWPSWWKKKCYWLLWILTIRMTN